MWFDASVVVYDSIYGNTERTAKSIGDSISSGSTVIRADKADYSLMGEFDLIIIGSPTHAGRPTKSVQDFLNRINGGSKTVPVAAFDTRLSGKGNPLAVVAMKLFGYAADKISKDLRKKGFVLKAAPEGFIVEGREGPLKQGELARAAEWAKSLSSK